METHSKRPRTNSSSSSKKDSDGKWTSFQEDSLYQFGYDQKKSLAEASDDRGDFWVHQKCATWTAATANANEDLSVTNLVLKALVTVNNIYKNELCITFASKSLSYNHI